MVGCCVLFLARGCGGEFNLIGLLWNSHVGDVVLLIKGNNLTHALLAINIDMQRDLMWL